MCWCQIWEKVENVQIHDCFLLSLTSYFGKYQLVANSFKGNPNIIVQEILS